jgi:hypothetical protein
MQSIAQIRVPEKNPKLKRLLGSALEEKIKLLYSLDYVYDPYKNEFLNPLINKILDTNILYIPLNRIKEKCEEYKINFNALNKTQRSLEEISIGIYGKDDSTERRSVLQERFGFFGLFGIIGIFFFILTIVSHIILIIHLTTVFAIVFYIFVGVYTVYNTLFFYNEGRFFSYDVEPFWNKSKMLFLSLNFIRYFYLSYLIYSSLDNWWLPLIIHYPLTYLINKIVTPWLSRQYWQIRAFPEFELRLENNL